MTNLAGLVAAQRTALSCGRPARRRRVWDDSPCPPGHNTPLSLRAITARQLQPLVRQHDFTSARPE